MKKVFASAVLALVLVAGTISGVSAAGNGNGAMDGTGTGVCVNEDCANYGENQAATQNRNQVNVSDQNLKQYQNQKETKAGVGEAGQNRQNGGEQGGSGTCTNDGAQLRDGSCEDCVNDGVRPLDGTGQQKGR